MNSPCSRRDALRVGASVLLAAYGTRAALAASSTEPSAASRRDSRWSADDAWAWYRRGAWPCGFNYVPANAISYTAMFMPDTFDPNVIGNELKLAQGVGFNCIRFVLPFVVWEHDPKAFTDRLGTFLDLCAAHGLRAMPALFDDCVFGPIIDPVYGPQPDVVPGWYANGWTPSPGHSMVKDKSTWPRLQKYVGDIVGTFASDSRVWLWDVYNEPTNGGVGDATVPLLEQVFAWARAAEPTQPLTVGRFSDNRRLNDLVAANVDVVSFHNYSPPRDLEAEILRLKEQGRPLICSEWLNRPFGSNVEGCLPIFRAHDVGCLSWGLVNGKTQTDLPWGGRPGQAKPTLWQHDLFRGDGTPYQPRELEAFKEAIAASQKR